MYERYCASTRSYRRRQAGISGLLPHGDGLAGRKRQLPTERIHSKPPHPRRQRKPAPPGRNRRRRTKSPVRKHSANRRFRRQRSNPTAISRSRRPQPQTGLSAGESSRLSSERHNNTNFPPAHSSPCKPAPVRGVFSDGTKRQETIRATPRHLRENPPATSRPQKMQGSPFLPLPHTGERPARSST